MILENVKAYWRSIIEPIAKALASAKIAPNTVTLIGFTINVLVGGVIATGHLGLGGALVLIVGALDTLDGSLARVTQKVSTFGAFLDSTLDRYSEAAWFLGLLIWFGRINDLHGVILVYLAAIGSLLVSYARARAEGLGLRCEVGLLARPERIVLLGTGLLVNALLYDHALLVTLWLLAILTNLTAAQRILHVWKTTNRR